MARAIDAALTPYHRILLLTLYATGVRNAELTHLKVSEMRWTHDGHRKTHRCRHPTSFSARPDHRGRMKPLSTTRNLCVCRRAQSLRALPFRKPRPSTFSSLVSVPVLRFRPLFQLPLSSVVLRRTASAHLDTAPSLNLIRMRPASAATTGGLLLAAFIERAPEHRARAHFFPESAPPIKR